MTNTRNTIETLIYEVSKKYRKRHRRRCKKAVEMLSLYGLAIFYIRLTQEGPEKTLEGKLIEELENAEWEEFPDQIFKCSTLEEAWEKFHAFYHHSREEPLAADIDYYEWRGGHWRGNYRPLSEGCYNVLEIPEHDGTSSWFFNEKPKAQWPVEPLPQPKPLEEIPNFFERVKSVLTSLGQGIKTLLT